MTPPLARIAGWGPTEVDDLRPVEGGVTAAAGFVAGGTVSGIKASGRPDLALVVAESRCAAAAKTTTNRVKASSCQWTDRVASSGFAQAVVINAGNANVCTPHGAQHTERMANAAAAGLGVAADDVFVMSTGVIGVPLPIDKIEQALPTLVGQLSTDGGDQAATAIMTTDTTTKQAAYEVTDRSGVTYRVGGMAKGVGMIEPTMATLLVVLTTDADFPPDVVDEALTVAVTSTFNRISVDGDRSTSDTAVLLASGRAGSGLDGATFQRAVHAVCADLAQMVVADGEGANRVAAVRVTSAASVDDAVAASRSVATSLLVRSALHGADPNWGRILMALGNSEVHFDPAVVTVDCAGFRVCEHGVAVDFDAAAVAAAMNAPNVDIAIDLGAGHQSATTLTCDLSPDYVRFNADYTT